MTYPLQRLLNLDDCSVVLKRAKVSPVQLGPSANGCPGFGLHLWMKVSNMVTIMKLALAAIQQPALIVFVGDHRQTPGGLSKGRAAAANRQKLLQRPLELRALNRPGDYLPPARLASLVALLWPDASQDNVGYCPLASTGA